LQPLPCTQIITVAISSSSHEQEMVKCVSG
jgi:hypothetical protein